MWHTKQLILHGGIILLAGLLSGAPFGRAVARGGPEAAVRAWRVAHTSLAANGVLLFALASVLPGLQLGASALALLVWAFVASGYGFTVALPLGAYCGQRGLKFAPPLSNQIVYTGNVIGVAGSLLGALILLWGAYSAL